jgi:DNA mismatch repair ATPase MutL
MNYNELALFRSFTLVAQHGGNDDDDDDAGVSYTPISTIIKNSILLGILRQHFRLQHQRRDREQENANSRVESESEQQRQEQNSNNQVGGEQQREEPADNSNNQTESEQRQQEQENSETDEVQSDQVNTTHSEPRNPQFASFSTRLATFDNWPRGLSQTPSSLAEVGFFYTGRSDITLCFHCGYAIGQWKPGDDPWIEHARRYGGVCTFVQLSKGMDFVIQHQLDPCSADVKISAPTNIDCSDNNINNNKNECKSLTCRVCMSESVGVMFAPCGHIVCCVDCSFGVKGKCPVCREHIREGVKVHIG